MIQHPVQRIERADKRIEMLFGLAWIGALLFHEKRVIMLEHSMRLCDRSTNSGESFFA
jgi:hypothetical protein